MGGNTKINVILVLVNGEKFSKIRKRVTQLVSNKIANSFLSLGYVLWDANPKKSWELRPKNLGNKNRFLKDWAKFFGGLKNQLNQA